MTITIAIANCKIYTLKSAI